MGILGSGWGGVDIGDEVEWNGMEYGGDLIGVM
jgi:hypothetical protein